MKPKYLVLGNHPIFRYVNKRCKSNKEVRKTLRELQENGYETELYKILPNGEEFYMEMSK